MRKRCHRPARRAVVGTERVREEMARRQILADSSLGKSSNAQDSWWAFEG